MENKGAYNKKINKDVPNKCFGESDTAKNNYKIMYNKKDLQINANNTLIIIDWDDTLYPTTWVMSNKIDLTDPKSRYKYLKHFEQLDLLLSATLKHMTTLGEVIIVTNAMPEWVGLSVSVLPKTKKILEGIDVISARLNYQNNTKMADWKKLTFEELIIRRSKKHKYANIISLGDAEFEYNALINLYKLNTIPHKYLKSIRFAKSPDYDILLEQIQMIRKNIKQICTMTRQMDMIFEIQ
jgi:hypothetical protein